jgi:hypothetical protein
MYKYILTRILQPTAKSARRADESPKRALSGLTLTKMRSILRQFCNSKISG